jgi:Family of unknown function (DUF5362)
MDSSTDYTGTVPGFDLTLSLADRGYLAETGRWARFLGIIGYILTGFIVLAALAMGTVMGDMAKIGAQTGNPMLSKMEGGFGIGFAIIYLLLALLYFFPSYYLHGYGTNLGRALREHDNAALTAALGREKSFFKFWGVMMIIMLALYALVLVAMLVGAGFMASRGGH